MLKPLLVPALLALVVAAAPVRAQQQDPQTVQQQVALQGLPVFGSDGRELGRVKQVRIGGDGQVGAVRAELTPAQGAQGKMVEIPAAKFTQKADRIVLLMTAEELDKLPAIE